MRHRGLAVVTACLAATILAPPSLTAQEGGTARELQDDAGDTGAPQEAIPAEIVVTAAAPPEPDDPAVSVVEADDARERGAETVADAVAAVPGVTVRRTGSGFEPVTVTIRGSTAEQVLVLKDGRPVTGPGGGAADLSRTGLDGVQRIEVVRGAAAARYGAGAAAGVINIVTTHGNGTTSPAGGTARLSAGSFGEARASTDLTANVASRSRLAISAGGVLSANRYTYTRSGEKETRINAGGGEGSAAVTLTTPVVSSRAASPLLEIGAHATHGERGLAGSVEFPSSSARLTDSEAGVRLALLGRAFAASAPDTSVVPPTSPTARAGGWRADTTVSVTERAFRDPDATLGAVDEFSRLLRGSAEATLHHALADVRFRLSASADLSVLDERDEAPRQRRRGATALTLSSPPLPLAGGSMEAGLDGRLEAVGESDATVERSPLSIGEASFLPSVRATLAWERVVGTAGIVEVGAAAGTGHRLPTFAELFWSTGAFAVGNPTLEAERSRSVELSVAGRSGGGFSWELRGHAAWYDQLIQWLPDPRGVWQPRNTGKARVAGIEAVAGVDRPVGFSPWNVLAEVRGEVLSSVDRTPGATVNRQLPYRPEGQAGATLALTHLGGGGVEVTTEAVGTRPVTAANTRWLDPYVRVDISGRTPVGALPVTLGAAIHNLLDERFVETRFFPNPGREVVIFAEVTW